jgi:LmbE family N-acetylglucosaminyl deacetylase
MEAGNRIPLGPSERPLVPPAISGAGEQPVRVVVGSPHPDDEALVGALPLRLRLETGARVTDGAITLGSNLSQRARRLRELESACRVLGFDLAVPLHPAGFDNVNLKNRVNRPDEWAAKVETLSAIFDRLQPDVVFAPHAEDFNTTHIGTHYLAVDALGAYLERSGRGPLLLIETEYWHENAQPNLMVGVSPEVEAILVMATAEHGGEVLRNPYHLRHPSRMIENVRLGAEVVGGQGGPAPDFPFAELYRVTFMKGREVIQPKPGGRIVGPMEKIDVAWLLEQFRPEGL